jgi:hypothetical protein
MIGPLLVTLWLHIGETKSVNNIAVIVGKALSEQSLDVLEYKRFRLDLAHSADGVREHIPLVFMSAMLSAERKGLTRRTTGNEFDAIPVREEIVQRYIFLDDSPIACMPCPSAGVPAERIAGVMIPFNYGFVFKARIGSRDCQSAGE